ncbi:hypothetical protein I4F81_011099 [Pyropia yezoensis]|uniref:Uncharacterized protein n=1 Tax=Pyropia yezoensis TaxID=2788 RepID=A0ACC3CF94_PYRYE|nr:hypothetical protein I4F81_011099 [Neopyropia yezoensis]
MAPASQRRRSGRAGRRKASSGHTGWVGWGQPFTGDVDGCGGFGCGAWRGGRERRSRRGWRGCGGRGMIGVGGDGGVRWSAAAGGEGLTKRGADERAEPDSGVQGTQHRRGRWGAGATAPARQRAGRAGGRRNTRRPAPHVATAWPLRAGGR